MLVVYRRMKFWALTVQVCWKTHRPQIKMKKHMRFAKCDECTRGSDKMAASSDPLTLRTVRRELDAHYKASGFNNSNHLIKPECICLPC